MSATSLNNREFQQFRDMIYQVAGIAMSDAKRQLIAGRLSKRLRRTSSLTVSRTGTSVGYFSIA